MMATRTATSAVRQTMTSISLVAQPIALITEIVLGMGLMERTVTEMYEELISRLKNLAMLTTENGDSEIRISAEAVQTIREITTQAADAIEDLISALTASNEVIAKNKPRWIPVTEQCPEKSGDYLVFDDCRNLYVNDWHCLLKKWQYDDSRITHWMPLPEPPKEET